MGSDGLIVIAYASQKKKKGRGLSGKRMTPNHLFTLVILGQNNADIKTDKKASEGIPFKGATFLFFFKLAWFSQSCVTKAP